MGIYSYELKIISDIKNAKVFENITDIYATIDGMRAEGVYDEPEQGNKAIYEIVIKKIKDIEV